MDNFKKIVKFVFNKRITILIIVVIFLLAVLLPSFVYYITIDDGTYKENDWKSTPYVASTYINSVTVDSTGISSEITAQELWDKMIKDGNNIEDYLDSPEELQKLMNAEIITKYPKIGNDETDLDGVIEFERHKTDGTSTKLKYVNKKTFNNYIETKDVTNVMSCFTLDENGNVLVGVVDKTTYELKSNDSDINISNYTDNLNDSNKVSDGKYKNVEYNISSKTINYKNTIEKYSMPFQYLWALLVISDDKDFVLELADLVSDSEIIISIYDNMTTIINKSEYTYNKESRIDTYAEVVPDENYGVSGYPSKRYWVGEGLENYNSSYPADYSIEETKYEVEQISTYENNTPIVSLSKANVWIGEYSKEYTYKRLEEEKEESNSKELEDSEYKEDENSPKNSNEDTSLLNNGHALSLKEECKSFIQDKLNKMKNEENKKTLTINGVEVSIDDVNVSVNVSYVQCNSYSHEINRTQADTTLMSSQQYVEGNTVNNTKIEKDAEQLNFVTILSSSEHREAKRNILENSSWLFELLETNPDTVNMVDLTKYFLYNLTGNSYGVTEYDFKVYEENNFATITSSGTDISLISTMFTKEVFVQALTEYSNSGASGNKANFDKNFLSRAEEIYDLGKKNNLNPEIIVTMALKESGFYDKGTNNFWGLETPNGASLKSYTSFEEAVKKLASTFATYMPGGRLSSMIENRAAERQAAGANSNGYGNSGTLKGMLSVYSDLCGSDTKHREGNSGNGGNYYLKVIYGSEFQSKCGSVHQIGVDDYTIQEKADYTAWLYEKQLDYWNNIFGKFGKLSTGNTEQIKNMINRAIEIANDDSHRYVWGATGPQNFDCSGFMQYLYREYCGIQIPRTSEEQRKYGEKQNAEIPSFTADNKNINDLQAGDLLWVSGHVGMYIGDGKFVHAASSDTGIVVSNLSTRQNGSKPFTKAFRIVK